LILRQWHFEQPLEICRWIPGQQALLLADSAGNMYQVDVESQGYHLWANSPYAVIDLAISAQAPLRVMTTHENGRLCLWNREGQIIHEWAASAGKIVVCSLSQDGQWAASASDAGHLELWRLPSAELHLRIQVPMSEPSNLGVTCCALSENGQLVLTGQQDGLLHLWSVQDGRLLQTYTGHHWPIQACAFRGELILSCAAEMETSRQTGEIRVWDIMQQDSPIILRGQARMVNDCHIELFGEVVGGVTSGVDGSLHLWDLRRGVELAHYRFDPSGMATCDVQGLRIARADVQGRLYLLEYQRGQVQTRHQGALIALACHADRLYSIAADQRLSVTGLATGQQEASLGLGNLPSALAMDDSFVFIGFEDGQLHCYDRHSLRLRWEANAHSGPLRVLLAWSEGRVISGGQDGLLAAWNGNTGARLSAVAMGQAPQQAALFPQGVLVLGSNGQVGAWDVMTGQHEHYSDWPEAVALACQGQQVWLGDAEGCIWQASLANTSDLTYWQASQNAIQHLALQGPYLYSTDADGRIAQWDWATTPIHPRAELTLAPITAILSLESGGLALGDSLGTLYRLG
jgi:WD40 repeat protein